MLGDASTRIPSAWRSPSYVTSTSADALGGAIFRSATTPAVMSAVVASPTTSPCQSTRITGSSGRNRPMTDAAAPRLTRPSSYSSL
jgi:hypothetical protein